MQCSKKQSQSLTTWRCFKELEGLTKACELSLFSPSAPGSPAIYSLHVKKREAIRPVALRGRNSNWLATVPFSEVHVVRKSSLNSLFANRRTYSRKLCLKGLQITVNVFTVLNCADPSFLKRTRPDRYKASAVPVLDFFQESKKRH